MKRAPNRQEEVRKVRMQVYSATEATHWAQPGLVKPPIAEPTFWCSTTSVHEGEIQVGELKTHKGKQIVKVKGHKSTGA